MTILILGLVLFIGAHSFRTAPSLRDRLVGRLGENAYRGLASLASLAGVVLVVWGYGLARADPLLLWQPPAWGAHVAWLLMAVAFILLAAAFLPGRIRTTVRHPMVTAVILWALAHLLANGTAADAVLFGAFLAWSVWDRISLAARERAGEVTVTGGPARNDAIAVVAGLAVYALFLYWGHDWLIGVPPGA